ncbi:MAG: tRNA threonylcarbamoyladenosine dehydratase [Clostridia bacterium]|nr:tRNA threonylcarbamoyladenosine dehydratase [Clostridia bacterium]
MNEMLSRTKALYGEENALKLKNMHVAVFGLGGVGCYAVEALARSGIGAITLVDCDSYSKSNLNRQLYATKQTIGLKKTDVCCARIKEISENVSVFTFNVFIDENTVNQIDFSSFSYVIDAIDFLNGKIAIVKKCKENGVKVISSMGTGNKIDPTAFKVEDIYKTKQCPLAKKMRLLCRENNIESLKVVYSEELPRPSAFENGKRVPASNSFVPPVAGLILAGTVINELIGEQL